MIKRLSTRVDTRVEFRGGPSPRIPDSLSVPQYRRNMLPVASSTVVVNTMFGIGPYLRNHYVRRVVPFNITHGNTIIQQSASRHNTRNVNRVTNRKGAPANLSYLVPPIR